MAEYPADNNNIPLPIYGEKGTTTIKSPEDDQMAAVTEHEETIPGLEHDATDDLHRDAAIAAIRQQHTIPATGKRMPTSKWEYIFFCVFCEQSCPQLR